MSIYTVGDLVTFRLHDDSFGLARVIVIESLSQFDRVHLQIMDAVLGAGPGGENSMGDPISRTHDLSECESAPVVVDHLCVELDAFERSEPLIVGHTDVEDGDLVGYRVWLALQHDQMVRSGVIGDLSRDERELGDQTDGDELDGAEPEEVPDGVGRAEAEAPMEALEESNDDSAEEEGAMEARERAITVLPWHSLILREPVGDGLVNLHAVFREPELLQTHLGEYLCGIYSSDNIDRINELAGALLDGDFGAGQELMEFGDAAVDVLATHLHRGDLDAQQTEDLLNILTDIASLSAYEAIGSHVARHIGHFDSETGRGVARAFCYAVMLTGGSPPPLQRVLHLLDSIDHPDLRADVANAKRAVLNAGPPNEGDVELQPKGTSSTPFGTIGI